MWLVLDVIIVLLLLIFAYRGMKKGLIKSTLGITVVVISAAIALNFYNPVSDYLRSTVVYNNLVDGFESKISEYISGSFDSEDFSELMDKAPDGIKSILAGFGTSAEDVGEKYSEILTEGQQNASDKISDYVVTPASETLSNALAIIILFFACILLLNIAIAILDAIFKLPVLNLFNKLGGFAVGAFVGLLVCFVFSLVVNISLPYLHGAGIDIDAQSAGKAILFSKITEINPLSFLY